MCVLRRKAGAGGAREIAHAPAGGCSNKAAAAAAEEEEAAEKNDAPLAQANPKLGRPPHLVLKRQVQFWQQRQRCGFGARAAPANATAEYAASGTIGNGAQ